MPATPLITARAKWIWTPDVGSAITLNDGAKRSGVIRGSDGPYYQILWPVKGLRALPDSPDNREANTEAIGETVYDSYASGKTITISGRCFGRTHVERIQGDDDLVAAFGPDVTTGKLQGGRMVIEPNAALSTQLMTFTAVCRDAEPVEGRASSPSMSPSPYFSEFTIDLRLADPRFYLWDGAAATAPRW